MSIEQQLYETILLLSGAVNMALAIMLVHNNVTYHDYPVYRRARLFTALSFSAFSVGFLMHYFLQWRSAWPLGASALTVSYFHIGGVLFCWSNTSLLNYHYITRRVAWRDVGILALNLVCTWTFAAHGSHFYTLNTAFLVFFVHAAFLAVTLYRTYYSARHMLHELEIGDNARAIAITHKKFQLCCHLIVGFGIGSVAFTKLFPHDMWPFSLLLVAGTAVFSYIFYAISEYSAIVRMATLTMDDMSVRSSLPIKARLAALIFFCVIYPTTIQKGNTVVLDKPQQTEQTEQTQHTQLTQKIQQLEIDELRLQNERELLEHKHSQMRLYLLIAAMFVVTVTLYLIFTRSGARRLQAANAKLSALNSQLLIANERAEESSRMKSNFIRQISHEIRTPLNVLSGFTQVITSPDIELTDDERQEINHGITENTERITTLVDKMLELSDASSQTVIERTDAVTPDMVAELAVEQSGIASHNPFTFASHISTAAKAATMTTNLVQASRALVQLLDNAMKYTNQQGEAASASLDVDVTDSIVRFTVEDNGIGIPQTESEHIFDEFVQLDDNCEGTGIGLTVARSLTRRLGGDVVLDTSCTTGARFVMTLPLTPVDKHLTHAADKFKV